MKYSRFAGAAAACSLVLAACVNMRDTNPANLEPARSEIAKEVSAAARRVAVSIPGARVCRGVPVGISEHELLRGVVTESGATEIKIRLISAGRFPVYVGATEAKAGTTLSDLAANWTPCTW